MELKKCKEMLIDLRRSNKNAIPLTNIENNTIESFKESCKTSFSLQSIKILIAVIRPTVEYGTQVWNGRITKDQSKQIELIKKRTSA